MANRILLLALVASCGLMGGGCEKGGGESLPTEPFRLLARSRVGSGDGDKTGVRVIEQKLIWQPEKTAIIICDMWDDHWCAGAARRVGEMAPAMNRVVAAVRRRGAFVIHAPSSVVDFYEGSSQRGRATQSPFAPTPVPLSVAERWGTNWCWPDLQREPAMPIDDSDMGCACSAKCEIHEAWKRQTDIIEIAQGDAITDDGQETWNLLAERGIEQVILMGVHLNMCVLGRPFGIRQMVGLGKQVVLVRDLTDSMYDPRCEPFVDHFSGTDLVIEHVERYWCPSITSADLVGGEPFRFSEDRRGR